VVPTIEKQYIVQNNTTGSQSITVKTSAGTGITVPNGRKAHLYVDGTNVIQMFDFVDINGGTIDGTSVGASSASTGAFTTLTASGATTLNGAVALGDAAADLITFPGTVNSNLLFTDNTYDIGASGATRPRNLFLAGAATIGGNLSVGGTLTLTGGLILNGNVTVGDSSADTLTVNATITSNLLFTDNTYDIGASGATRPRNLFLAGNATIGGATTMTGALTVDSTTDSSSTTTGSIQTDGGVGIAKALYVGTTGTIRTVLTVGAAANTDAVALFDSLDANGSHLRLLNSNTVNTYFGAAAGISSSGTASDTALRAQGALYFLTNGNNPRVTVTTDGYVGIRTTSPAGFLHVAPGNAAASSTAGAPIILQAQQGGASASGGNILIGSGQNGSGGANGYIAFGIGSSTSGSAFASGEAVRITSDSNVGIGTSSPAAKLDTAGTVRSTSQTVPASGTGAELFYDSTNAGLRGYNRTGSAYVTLALNDNIYVAGGTSGNVGIGTTTSSIGKLVVAYTSAGSDPLAPAYAGLNLWGNSSVRLLFGTYTGSPYAAYIQASNTGTGFPIALNPSGGFVGVGTSAPAVMLDVTRNQNALTALNVFNNDSTNASSIAAIRVGYDATYHYSISRVGNSADIIHNATQSSANLIWQIGGSEQARIDSSGRFLVGTTSNFGGAGQFAINQGGGSVPVLHLIGTNGVGGGGREVSMIFSGVTNDTGPAYGNLARVGAGKENATQGNTAGYLVFSTTPNGGSLTERARITSTGVLQIANGGALNLTTTASGNGNISFDGSTFTLVSNSSSAPIVFSTNSTERARLTSGGLLGLAVSSPQTRLDMSGTLRFTPNPADTNYSADIFANYDSGHPFQINVKNNGSSFEFFGVYANAGGGGERVVFPNGNVGVGVTNPQTKLQVNSTAPTIRLEETTTGGSKRLEMGVTSAGLAFIGANQSAQDLTFQTVGSERARITSGGQFLVGTTATAGDASNTAKILGGVFATLRSSASVAHNTTTTIATLPSGEGNYIVSATLLNSSVPTGYNEVAIVRVSQSTSAITVLVDASSLSLSMSGLNLQVIHGQGATQTIEYSVLRIL